MTKHLNFLFTIIILIFTSSVGVAREWLVDRVSGTAYTISQSRERSEIKPDMKIAEGLTVATGPNGRVRLVSENNVMTLLPNSVAAVVPKSFFSSKTEVRQKAGSIEFDIERRKQPHFTVQTPYMAAVVKGTKFTVSVAKTTTNIGVTHGLVQVSDLRTGQTAAVGAGQNASVASAKGGLRTGGVNAPAVAPGKPATPSVAPLGMTMKEFSAAAQISSPSTPATSAAANQAGSTSAVSSDQNSGTSSTDRRESNNEGSGNAGGNDTGSGKPNDGDNPDKPDDNKPGKPGEDKPGKPGGDKPGKPGGDKSGKPGDDKPGKPGGDKPGKPGDDKPGKPGGDKPGKPGDDKPGKPGDDKPGKPGGDNPGKPGDDRPSKPGGDKPGKPGGDEAGGNGNAGGNGKGKS